MKEQSNNRDPGAIAQLTVHPLAEQFPDIPAKEFDELKRSISEIGLLEPLIINQNGQILDGRHRWRACQELGIEPYTIQLGEVLGINFGKVSEAKFIFDANYHRRHLTDDQRAAVAATFIPLLRQAAAKNKKAGKPLGGSTRRSTTRTQLAKLAKVSEEKAKQVVKLHDQRPELLDEVKAGKKKLVDAIRDIDTETVESAVEVETKVTSFTDVPTNDAEPQVGVLSSRCYAKVEHWYQRQVPKLLSAIPKREHLAAYRTIADMCAAQLEQLDATKS